MRKAIIIGTNPEYDKYFFKLSEDNDFSFTPWELDVSTGCVHDQCIAYINDHIMANRFECDIDDLLYIGTKAHLTELDSVDIFIYKSDKFFGFINCDYIEYNDTTLDYDFNIIDSWILAYIHNKYSHKTEFYYYF